MKIWSLLNDLRFPLSIPLSYYTQREHGTPEYYLQMENLTKK